MNIFVQQDSGSFKGVRWSLLWTKTAEGHLVTLREDGQTSVVYSGVEHNDARSSFEAQQGAHFDDVAYRKRTSGI